MHYSVDVVDKPSEFDVIRKGKGSNSYVGILLLLGEQLLPGSSTVSGTPTKYKSGLTNTACHVDGHKA